MTGSGVRTDASKLSAASSMAQHEHDEGTDPVPTVELASGDFCRLQTVWTCPDLDPNRMTPIELLKDFF